MASAVFASAPLSFVFGPVTVPTAVPREDLKGVLADVGLELDRTVADGAPAVEGLTVTADDDGARRG